MQIYPEDLVDGRPVPPPGCPGHLGVSCPRSLQRHGCYLRYYSPDSTEKDAIVLDYHCEVCHAHFSVIPENMAPYRRVPSDLAQRYGDQQSRCDSEASQLPLEDENPEHLIPNSPHQRRTLQSHWQAFTQHALILVGLLSIALDSSPELIWRKLRQHPHLSPPAARSVRSILLALNIYQTALTKSYLSLKPWWQGGLARGWRSLTNPPLNARSP